jgi:hypothetical protein
VLEGEEEYFVCSLLAPDEAQFLEPVVVDLLVFDEEFVVDVLAGVGLLDAADVAQPGVHVEVGLAARLARIAHSINTGHSINHSPNDNIGSARLKSGHGFLSFYELLNEQQ